MKNILIQNYKFDIPQTTGTRVYSYTFKSDDLHNFLTGISAIFCGGVYPSENTVSVELRDDFKSILSFSPCENWIKETAQTNPAFKLTDTFKPLNVESKGKNFYVNVKATDVQEPFNFMVFFRQSDNEFNCKNYDVQTFEFKNITLGINNEINLPSDYNNVVGINAVFTSNSETPTIMLDINDSKAQQLDPFSLECLKVTKNVNYDDSFFPCEFYSKNKQVNVRFTSLTTQTLSEVLNVSVSFLLVK